MASISVQRAKFEQKLEENRSKNPANNRCVWNRKQLDHVRNVLATAGNNTKKKTSSEYHYLKKYELIEIQNESYIILKRKSDSDDYVYMVATEDYYPKLWEAHSQTGHGGRDKMLAYMKKNKWRIPRFACDIFVTCCEDCKRKGVKRHTVRKSVVDKPIVTNSFNGIGQVDLIDFQSTPDGEYYWLMNYQDQATKFLHLRPLKFNHTINVAEELSKIFFTFGTPSILQSENGREFVADVITQLVAIWPQFKTIQGRPYHPQTQDSIERTNVDVRNTLCAWMIDNKSMNWSRGCYEVQWMKNTSLNPITKKSPYEALLGPVVCGSTSSSLPDDVETIHVESDLEAFSYGQATDSQERASGEEW